MRSLIDEAGMSWRATAREEETTRHHGRWYLVFHPADDPQHLFPLREVRWQTRETAERTILSMSETELARRLQTARARAPRSLAAETAA